MYFFRFDVHTSEKDYIDYNLFWTLRSPYGRKQIRDLRIFLTFLAFAGVLVSLFRGSFTTAAFLGTIPYLIILLLSQIFLTKAMPWAIKSQIKGLKKNGKMGYSPDAVIEFSGDGFTETTPDNRTECKYSAIEQISIVDNKAVYIHVNNIMAYILPMSCFASREQYAAFLDFIKTKCAKVEMY